MRAAEACERHQAEYCRPLVNLRTQRNRQLSLHCPSRPPLWHCKLHGHPVLGLSAEFPSYCCHMGGGPPSGHHGPPGRDGPESHTKDVAAGEGWGIIQGAPICWDPMKQTGNYGNLASLSRAKLAEMDFQSQKNRQDFNIISHPGWDEKLQGSAAYTP